MTHPVTLVTDVTRFPTLLYHGRVYFFGTVTGYPPKTYGGRIGGMWENASQASHLSRPRP